MPTSIAPSNGQSSSKKGTFDENRHIRQIPNALGSLWSVKAQSQDKETNLKFGFEKGLCKQESLQGR
jgi:hypothetical protein